MTIPDYETLMLPMLKLFAEGARNVAECIPRLREEFSISDEETAEMLPGGRQSVLQSRAHWARTYLGHAGLLVSPKRNLHVISERGTRLLESKPERISNSMLEKFEEFSSWRKKTTRGARKGENIHAASAMALKQTPEDTIAAAISAVESNLCDELLQLVLDVNPQQFERLTLDVLAAMGYAGSNASKDLMTRLDNDSGDIREDVGGANAVFVEAKQRAPDNKISLQEIRKFAMSLTNESATRGVFVTTSDFSRGAKGFVEKIQQPVLLINGQKLAQLMIRHEVGVRSRARFVLRGVDGEYFTGLNDGLETLAPKDSLPNGSKLLSDPSDQ